MPAHHPGPGPVPDFLYGTAWKEDRTQALTELALRMGFRGIDTANQRRHYFEEGVGQGLATAYRAGVVTRADLFLQTKFTYRPGQDDRLPYDPAADLSTQVAQSMASSLEHLGTDHVDSYVLHGPASGHGWTDADAGSTRLLGVSNVSLRHLEQMSATGAETPAFVQNRCFARAGPGRVPLRAGGRDAAADRHHHRRAHERRPGQPRLGALRRRGAGDRVAGRQTEFFRPLFGYGVVSSLETSVGGGTVKVSPWLELDPRGNETTVDCSVALKLPTRRSGRWQLSRGFPVPRIRCAAPAVRRGD